MSIIIYIEKWKDIILFEEIEGFNESKKYFNLFYQNYNLKFDKIANMRCEKIFKNLIPKDDNYK